MIYYFLLQVHVRHWACNWGGRVVSCNCGVVLRDHNDVIELSCCNAILYHDTTTPLTLKIRSKKCLAPGISIKNKYPGIVNGQYEVSALLFNLGYFQGI